MFASLYTSCELECVSCYENFPHLVQAVYFNYHGDLPKALEHFLECANWQKAHSIFMTSVAHPLFLSGKILLQIK